MFLSLDFRYQKYGIKILFYIIAGMFLFVAAMIVMNNPISALIFFIISSAFLSLAIFLSRLSKKTKKVYKNGKGGYFGELISKSDRSAISFYYKLEDGRIGKTTQKISKKAFNKLTESQFTKIPIIIFNHQAVFDVDMVEDEEYEFPKEKLDISSELSEIKSTFHIGNLSHGLIWYLFAFLSAFVVIVLIIFGSSQLMYVFTLAPLIILGIMNPLPVVFFYHWFNSK